MSIIRDITTESLKYLKDDRILVFIGARQAGKTTILKQLKTEIERLGEPVYFLDLEDLQYLNLLNETPKNIFKIFTLDFKKKNYIFIDEIQYLKNPSNFLKYLYDEYAGKIKLIVSGSSAFYLDQKFKDSLAGRKKIFFVRTLSFREFLRFKKEPDSLALKLEKLNLEEREKVSRHYHEYLIYGGYPRVVLAELSEKEDLLREIAFSYIKKDIYEANIRQEEIFYSLFRVLASQAGNLCNASELANTLDVSKPAVDNYLLTMQKSFHLALVRPFFKNIRKEISKMPKVYFYDLGLRNFFFNNFKNFVEREDKGELLENATFRQLIEKHPLEAVRFWRTIDKKEIDFVAEEKEAIEVKVKPEKINLKDYQLFFKNYPAIVFSVATIDKTSANLSQYKIRNIWEI